ncbi:MAG TPA: choice-of-anchor Q domain-containing protein [Anaerolineales bacterium]|nr:choice-of-anchor Q domain-containing protein [Anaerolineales bacterium]
MSHKIFRAFFVLILVTGLVAVQAPQSAAAAGFWYVTPTGDDSNDCLSPGFACATINGAIGKASSGDIVYVAEGMYTGSGNEVVLFDRDMTLTGGWDETFATQSGTSTLDGQNARRGITVNSGVTSAVDHFALQNGNVTGNGGGILNAGTLMFTNSSISNSTAGSGTGSAIYNMSGGVLTLDHSSVDHNGSPGICFVIANEGIFSANNSVIEENITTTIYCASIIVINYSGTMTMTQTAVKNNPTGGGIYNYATLLMNDSVVSGNVGTDASGGIYSYGGILTVNNTTISGNTTSNGGGIFLGGGGTARLSNVTISNNTANTGGGIYNSPSSPTDVILKNTILAGNTAFSIGSDCNGNVGSAGYNLIGNTSNCNFGAATGDVVNEDPALGPLQDNGGPTFTHALLPQSAAIDGGNILGCADQDGNPFTSDQRGITRPQGIACDIGAYEYTFTAPGPATSLAIIGGSGQQTTLNHAFPRPLRVVALDDQGNRVSGVTVTFTAPASGPSGTFADTSSNTTMIVTDEGGVATTSTFIANDQAGAYTVVAAAGGLGSVNFNLEQIDRPANDNFANAEPFTSLPFTAIADITNATNEQSNEPQNCYSMDRTLWYSFTPTESMVVVVNSADGAIFTNVNIYRAGSGISDLQFLSCTGAGAFTTFIAEANQTYYLQVGSEFGEVGYIRIDLEQFPPPVNDNFVAASPVSSLPSTIDFGTIAATFETNEPSACGYPSPPYKTIWYSFTASQTGSVSASIPSSNFAPFLTIFSGTDLNNLTQLGCGQYSNKVTFRALQGQIYYFQVGGYYGESGYGTFLLEVAPPPQANFYFYPSDPSKYDTVQFCSSSYDPGNVGIQSFTWNFGDGATATEGCATHRYTADGNYTVQHTVTTIDGRAAAANPQVVQVRTHDVAITKITAPQSASSGQTRAITISVRNKNYPETITIDLYKSTPSGYVWVGSLTLQVPVSSGNKTTTFSINYTFTAQDAQVGKVTFRAVATIVGARDTFPSDNEAISSPPTRVAK